MADDSDGPAMSSSAGRALTASFERRAEVLARVRQMVRTELAAGGYDDAVAAAVVLAVGELVTNAMVHGNGIVGLTMTVDSDETRVEVTDEGSGQPAIRAVDPTGTTSGGWGLRIVDQVAHSWGTHRTDGRTLVWMTHRR